MADLGKVTLALEAYDDQAGELVVFMRVKGDEGPLGVGQALYLPVFPAEGAWAEEGDLEALGVW